MCKTFLEPSLNWKNVGIMNMSSLNTALCFIHCLILSNPSNWKNYLRAGCSRYQALPYYNISLSECTLGVIIMWMAMWVHVCTLKAYIPNHGLKPGIKQILQQNLWKKGRGQSSSWSFGFFGLTQKYFYCWFAVICVFNFWQIVALQY